MQGGRNHEICLVHGTKSPFSKNCYRRRWGGDYGCLFLFRSREKIGKFSTKENSIARTGNGAAKRIFQIEDWKALQEIPYGEIRSYQQIAEQLGNPKACRAVGMANHCNPISVIIPCHRVIGKNGSLTGYAEGIQIKQALLDLEHQNI